MRAATSLGRKTIRMASGLVNLFVLTVILLLVAFSGYAIWDSGQVHNAASARNYEMYKPTIESETASFAELQAINPDVFAWLTVYGTNIDYPLVQGADNLRYINTDAKGRHSPSGAIFLDYRASPNFSDFSNILYGHHMENQVMFGEIGLFSDKNYFDARQYGMLHVDGQDYGLTFFAFVHADAYDFDVFRVNITEREEQEAYLALLMQMASHTREDVSVTADNRIILLSTCSSNSTNGRDILIAKITDILQRDPFEREEAGHLHTVPMIDGLSNFWAQNPLWVNVGLVAMASLLILLTAILVYTKRRRR